MNKLHWMVDMKQVLSSDEDDLMCDQNGNTCRKPNLGQLAYPSKLDGLKWLLSPN